MIRTTIALLYFLSVFSTCYASDDHDVEAQRHPLVNPSATSYGSTNASMANASAKHRQPKDDEESKDGHKTPQIKKSHKALNITSESTDLLKEELDTLRVIYEKESQIINEMGEEEVEIRAQRAMQYERFSNMLDNYGTVADYLALGVIAGADKLNYYLPWGVENIKNLGLIIMGTAIGARKLSDTWSDQAINLNKSNNDKLKAQEARISQIEAVLRDRGALDKVSQPQPTATSGAAADH